MPIFIGLVLLDHTLFCLGLFFVSLFSVPSLHIQLYSCCLSQVSLFGSSLGACVSMFSVILLLSLCCFRWLCIGLCSFVRCSVRRILIGLRVSDVLCFA